MGSVLHFVARIAEDEHGGHKPRDSNDGSNDGGKSEELPWWAILIIVYITVFTLLFLSSLTYFWKREKARETAGRPFRTRKVLLKALSVATGIWTWFWVFKKRGWGGPNPQKDRAGGGGPYEKIEARKTASAAGTSVSAPASSGASTTSARYGTPTSKNTSYAQYSQPNDMIKAPGYNPYSAFGQHDYIQMKTLSPRPSPSPSPSPIPVPSPSHTPLPPYLSTPPPPVAIHELPAHP